MRLRSKRMVILHLSGDQPSFEGIDLGHVGAHYRLANAKMLKAEDETIQIDGIVEVPRSKVLFRQVLG